MLRLKSDDSRARRASKIVAATVIAIAFPVLVIVGGTFLLIGIAPLVNLYDRVFVISTLVLMAIAAIGVGWSWLTRPR